MRHLAALAICSLALACSEGRATSAEGEPAASRTAVAPAKVGYDIRRLRPRNLAPLATMFDEMRAQTLAEGKHVAVLFSADWCEPCRTLDLELGNLHPAEDIGHVRIIELKEEDWERATRMNEFNELRRRWSAPLNVYPLFVLLDERGEKIEEMTEAKERLEASGVEATLPNWFRALRGG